MEINVGYKEKVINEDPEFVNNKKYKEYRRKWRENPKKMIVEDKPLYLAIESTNNCNLSCLFCQRTKRINAGNYRVVGIMQSKLYRKIIDEISELGVYSIKLNKDGEPLMNPNIVEFVRYAKEKGIMEVMFNTNAMRLNEKMSEGLIKAKLDKILISFDSPYREKYNRLRAGSDYDLVLKNIRKLKELKDKLGSVKPIIRINMIKMNNTANEEIEKFNKLFQDVADILAIQDYSDFVKDGEAKNLVCQELWQRLVVFWDGKVLPCCGDFFEEYILGDANTDSIKNIWLGKKLNVLREIHKKGKSNKIPMCKRCTYQML